MAAVSITGSDVVPGQNASFQDGVAGEAIDAGDWVAFETDEADGDYGKVVKAEQADPSRSEVIGIAVNAALAAGQPVRYATPGSDVTVGSVVAQGTIYVLGTDGAMEEEADRDASDYVVVCAVGKSGTSIRVLASYPDVQHP